MMAGSWMKLGAALGGMALVGIIGVTTLEGCMRRTFGASAEALAGSDAAPARGSSSVAGKAMASFGEHADDGDFGLSTPSSPPPTAKSAEPSMSAPSRPAPRPMPSRRQEHGQLTAGDWDDNLNFPFFLSYVDRFLSGRRDYPHLTVSDRAVISVRNTAGEPVPGARVTVSGGHQRYFTGTTAADGRVLFVPGLDGAPRAEQLTVTVEPPADQAGIAPVRLTPPAEGHEWRVELAAEDHRPQALDLAFVVDTTGSMGDELEYLKAEIQGISDSVKRVYGNIDIRYALVVYRDHGDVYVTKTQNFTDLATFRSKLDVESADGGGDTPEAVDEAMVAMNELSWRSGNVARVAFLVADAPAHQDRAQKFLAQADVARKRGVRLYSVAASGTDDEAEFLMRQASELTLARYLFLTDDSGIGNSHAEPHIPCYQVQRLSALVARMIRTELTGVREEAQDVLRSVGSPSNGVCRKDNQIAYYY